MVKTTLPSPPQSINEDRNGKAAARPSSGKLLEDREKRVGERDRLRTSLFDSVTSFFLSLILLIGTFTFMLFVAWLTIQTPTMIKPLAPIIENAAGRGDNAEGFGRDFAPPGAEEVEELLEPTLADSIEAVTDAVSNVAAALDTMDTNANASTQGSGQGDSRPPGPEGEGADIVPRFERWQLNFSAKGIRPYAEQLEFYKIELGAIGGSIQGVDYVSNLTGSPKSRRNPKPDEEKRLYFMFTAPSPLKAFDEQLIGQAGVPTQGRQTMKFIPEQLENELAHPELQYAKSKGHESITEVAKTIFESKSEGNGYKFVIVDQRYRRPRVN